MSPESLLSDISCNSFSVLNTSFNSVLATDSSSVNSPVRAVIVPTVPTATPKPTAILAGETTASSVAIADSFAITVVSAVTSFTVITVTRETTAPVKAPFNNAL